MEAPTFERNSVAARSSQRIRDAGRGVKGCQSRRVLCDLRALCAMRSSQCAVRNVQTPPWIRASV